MPGVTVDGQSVMEVFEVGKQAIDRARSGEGPTLIEAQTYRFHGHFGADDPLGYRTKEEEAYYRSRDCLVQLPKHILEGAFATEPELADIDDKMLQAVQAATQFANDSPFPEPEELLTDVYVTY